MLNISGSSDESEDEVEMSENSSANEVYVWQITLLLYHFYIVQVHNGIKHPKFPL